MLFSGSPPLSLGVIRWLFLIAVVVAAPATSPQGPTRSGGATTASCRHSQRCMTVQSFYTVFVTTRLPNGTKTGVVPYKFRSDWSLHEHWNSAVNFCKREGILGFDCFQRLAKRTLTLSCNVSSSGACAQDQPECATKRECEMQKQRMQSRPVSPPMVYFLHLHKAGGTAVCNIARVNSLTDSRNNCNPTTRPEIEMMLGDAADQKALLRTFRDNGTLFVANEYGLPRDLIETVEIPDTIPAHKSTSIVYTTMLREPASRCFSHFRQATQQVQYALTLGRSKSLRDTMNLRHDQQKHKNTLSTQYFRHVRPTNLSTDEIAARTQPRAWTFWTKHQPGPTWFSQNYDLDADKPDFVPHKAHTQLEPSLQIALGIGNTFLEWLRSSPDNLQFRVLCGVACAGIPRDLLTSTHFTSIRERLDRYFDVVGVLEAFELSMSLLGRHLDAHDLTWYDNERRDRLQEWSERRANSIEDTRRLMSLHSDSTERLDLNKIQKQQLKDESLQPTSTIDLRQLFKRLNVIANAATNDQLRMESRELISALRNELQISNRWDKRIYDYARSRLAHQAIREFGGVNFVQFFQQQIFYDDDRGIVNLQVDHERRTDEWNGNIWQEQHQAQWHTEIMTLPAARNCSTACCTTCLPLGGWFESVVRIVLREKHANCVKKSQWHWHLLWLLHNLVHPNVMWVLLPYVGLHTPSIGLFNYIGTTLHSFLGGKCVRVCNPFLLPLLP